MKRRLPRVIRVFIGLTWNDPPPLVPHPWDNFRAPGRFPVPDPMDGVQPPDPRPVQTLGELLRKTR